MNSTAELRPTTVVSPTSGSPAALRWASKDARRRQGVLMSASAWHVPLPPLSAGARLPSASREPGAAFAQAEQDLPAHVRAALGGSCNNVSLAEATL